MSWGYRITFLYLGFVGIIITLVTISSQNKEELVAKDYYAQELLYQNKLNAINNEKQLDKSITHEVTDASIILTSPFEKSKGTIQFFCPSDSKKDKSFPMNFSDGVQSIPKTNLAKGIYKLQISWEANNKNYFKEEIITLK
ncbi:MAG: hypothetical protein K0S12_770 [Bacteroidetes bacterium]|jgi:hypothetical protein|nr:hypothetical protein [Bacteroidota bacterium]